MIEVFQPYQHVITAAERAGNIIRELFGKSISTKVKLNASDLQTEADLRAEATIIAMLKEHYPQYNIYGEESGFIDNGSEYTFYIDPLDGTNNFVLGIPHFSTSIALLHNDSVIFGVVHQPILQNTYCALQGHGAYLNDNAINTNDCASLQQATLGYVIGYATKTEFNRIATPALINLPFKRFLTLWSPAIELCMLADGKTDILFNYDSEIYDFAAGKLIAREAGAIITDLEGQEEPSDRNKTFLVSSNPNIHQKTLTELQPIIETLSRSNILA